MKWLVLQLLTLYCLVITPVTGSMREKRTVIKPQEYIIVEPKLRTCVRKPTPFECYRICRTSWDCPHGYECCFSSCGNICLHIRVVEGEYENTSPPTMAETTSYTTSTTESWESNSS
ncbi:WAP four-disulfide core domain protein 10A-like [Lutra lutra]|uniref:WAP four-disulfide core domain protein 10A-like n=1 Tax=Lutra lutra TaxID=9657 RepID=UPI001FD23DD2|nr:WAP four-disulfide core domain protein 10A-like [Lutra lutra]